MFAVQLLNSQHALNMIPFEYLGEVDKFLSSLNVEINSKEENRKKILAFAGSWTDMTQEDFDDYKKSISDFNKNV